MRLRKPIEFDNFSKLDCYKIEVINAVYEVDKGTKPCSEILINKDCLDSLKPIFETKLKYKTYPSPNRDGVYLYLYKYEFIENILELLVTGVDKRKNTKAHDGIRGLLFGYACKEIEDFINRGYI